MFQINSKRIQILALQEKQLLLLAEDRNRMEMSLGLARSQFELNTDPSFLIGLTEAIRNQVTGWVQQNPQDYLWFTHWLILEKETNLTIGGIGAAGLPNEKGEGMIGYYIDRKSEGKGYATEAVKLFTGWMFLNTDLQWIIADTLIENIPSQKVLEKNGFVQTGTTDEGLRWKLKRDSTFEIQG